MDDGTSYQANQAGNRFPLSSRIQNLQPEIRYICLVPSGHHLVINFPPVSLGLNLDPKKFYLVLGEFSI